jgi:hypothetical protein
MEIQELPNTYFRGLKGRSRLVPYQILLIFSTQPIEICPTEI